MYADELIERIRTETGLPAARLTGERAAGDAHRGVNLVRANPTLYEIWELIGPLTGEEVIILADFDWSAERVEAINFSLQETSIDFDDPPIIEGDPELEPADALCRAHEVASKKLGEGVTLFGDTPMKALQCIARIGCAETADHDVIWLERLMADYPGGPAEDFRKGEAPISSIILDLYDRWGGYRLSSDDDYYLRGLHRAYWRARELNHHIYQRQQLDQSSISPHLMVAARWRNQKRRADTLYRCAPGEAD